MSARPHYRIVEKNTLTRTPSSPESLVSSVRMTPWSLNAPTRCPRCGERRIPGPKNFGLEKHTKLSRKTL